MTRQAIQLDLCPRLHITQTSSQGYGEIYVGFVNWTLMVLTLALTISFRSSDNLASAFGIVVALTKFLTSVLIVPRHARGVGLEPLVERSGRRPVRHRRPVVRGRQHDEGEWRAAGSRSWSAPRYFS
jgi:hypothetical protein